MPSYTYIQDISVLSYQRLNDCTLYPVQTRFFNNQVVETKHDYADFIQFSRYLHQYHTISKADLPKLKKQLYFLKKGSQKYMDRQLELQDFCRRLLLLPASITCSNEFIAFFSNAVQPKPSTSLKSTNSIKRAFSLRSKKQDPPQTEVSSRFTRSVGQEQASSIIDYRSNRSSTTSTTSTSSILFSSSLSSSDEEDTVKLKIVYDIQNIIIIRVSRYISLDQLRSRVVQKFALLNIPLPDQLVLRATHCARYSASSSASTILCSDQGLETQLLTSEEDLAKAMLQDWVHLPKVTLRCVV